ncbi:hypothetical protein BYT27DRAFT_7101306, partial [Phlegmacium glaucopus]
FIVDAYHYINHRTNDFLCWKFCNPGPLDGSAPNLVVMALDRKNKPYLKRAFNTQACEQLNAWLGGFDSILKCMTPGNFNWFLHTMLQEPCLVGGGDEARAKHCNNRAKGCDTATYILFKLDVPTC